MTQKDLNRDFSRKTINALNKKGIRIYRKTWLPHKDGGAMSYANGETGYVIDDNGMSKVKTFTEMMGLI